MTTTRWEREIDPVTKDPDRVSSALEWGMLPLCLLACAAGIYERDIAKTAWPITCLIWVFNARQRRLHS